MVLAGWLYQIPVVIHESDSVPGLTNKFSSPAARKSLFLLKNQRNFSKDTEKNWCLLAIPLGKTVLRIKRKAIKNFNLTGQRKIILIMGGSQDLIKLILCFDVILKYIERYEIIHICGPNNFKDINLFTMGALENEQKFYHLYPS